MLENINETKEEVTELNMKYMDISTKLTLLQNHQLLVQLDYQTQQLEESTKKKKPQGKAEDARFRAQKCLWRGFGNQSFLLLKVP